MNDAKRYNYSAVQLINCAEWIKNIAWCKYLYELIKSSWIWLNKSHNGVL
jgi:hypothetical protein